LKGRERNKIFIGRERKKIKNHEGLARWFLKNRVVAVYIGSMWW